MRVRIGCLGIVILLVSAACAASPQKGPTEVRNDSDRSGVVRLGRPSLVRRQLVRRHFGLGRLPASGPDRGDHIDLRRGADSGRPLTYPQGTGAARV